MAFVADWLLYGAIGGALLLSGLVLAEMLVHPERY